MIVFNPTNTIIGGLLLGTASFYYRFFYGRALGISGFLNSQIFPKSNDGGGFKWFFLLGLFSVGFFYPQSELKVDSLSFMKLPFAGFLVGFGTRLGNGCTSGHGLCGLPRFSYRSVAAVITFMLTGMITRMATINESHLPETLVVKASSLDSRTLLLPILALSICQGSFMLSKKIRKSSQPSLFEKLFLDLVSILWGAIFGMGLIITGMTWQEKVFHFLNFPTIFTHSRFDPSLAVVMGSGIIPSLLGHFLLNETKPFMSGSCLLSDPSKEINWKLVFGAAVFGIGWGLGGICPGPAVVLFGNEIGNGKLGSGPMSLWISAMFLGSHIASYF
jgi:uncharacterized membrane protein YedE/YeeE